MCTFVKDCVKYSSFKSSKIFSSVQVFWVSLCANSFSLPWAWGWTITFLRVLKIGLILKVSSLRNHSWTYMWKKIRSPEPSALYGSSRKTPLAIWPPKGRNSWGTPPKAVASEAATWASRTYSRRCLPLSCPHKEVVEFPTTTRYHFGAIPAKHTGLHG